jgi:hypothetical protein
VAARIGESQYVAPDNGLLTGLLDAGASQAVRIEGSQVRRPGPGATFDGRDVFAPAAAHLALGLPMSRLGAPIEPESLVRLPDLRARRADGRIVGSVVVVDRFGNLRTNIPQDWLPTEPITRLLSPDGAERTSLTGLRRAYGEARAGELLAYVGSAGTLEIGVRDGSAAEQLHLESGAGVVVEPW